MRAVAAILLVAAAPAFAAAAAAAASDGPSSGQLVLDVPVTAHVSVTQHSSKVELKVPADTKLSAPDPLPRNVVAFESSSAGRGDRDRGARLARKVEEARHGARAQFPRSARPARRRAGPGRDGTAPSSTANARPGSARLRTSPAGSGTCSGPSRGRAAPAPARAGARRRASNRPRPGACASHDRAAFPAAGRSRSACPDRFARAGTASAYGRPGRRRRRVPARGPGRGRVR